MLLFRTKALIVIFAFAVSMGMAATLDQNASTQEMDIDHSIKPGDGFYRYANGGWLTANPLPAGQQSYDTRAILVEKTSLRVRDLIQGASSAQSVRGSIAQKVGNYYASFIDEDGIEAKGLGPLADEMARISAIANKAALSAYLGATLNTEVEGLTANADHVFGVWVNQSFSESEHYVFHLWQGGLGMPDRDSYLDPSPKMAGLRAQYQAHIAASPETRGYRRLGNQSNPHLVA